MPLARRVSLKPKAYHGPQCGGNGLCLGPYFSLFTFEPARSGSAFLAQVLEGLSLPDAAALSVALSLAEGDGVDTICEKLAKRDVGRYEAATASGQPALDLSA